MILVTIEAPTVDAAARCLLHGAGVAKLGAMSFSAARDTRLEA